MKRIAVALLALAAIGLTGCPVSTSQRQQIANALDNTTIVIKDAQQAEIIAVNNKLIFPQDDIFVQTELTALTKLGKTTDACVLTATDTTGALSCLQSELVTIKQIQADGALNIKSANAQSAFNTVLTSATAVVSGIYTAVGGK
jgi:outer membrane biogenesis lipoprotein LolB